MALCRGCPDMGAYEFRFVLKLVEFGKTAGGEIHLTWSSRAADTYIIWACPDLVTGSWIDVATVPSQGTSTTWSDTTAESNVRMFYRIEIE